MPLKINTLPKTTAPTQKGSLPPRNVPQVNSEPTEEFDATQGLASDIIGQPKGYSLNHATSTIFKDTARKTLGKIKGVMERRFKKSINCKTRALFRERRTARNIED